METFSVLLAICAGNSPVYDEFPAQRPVTRSFDVFFDLRLSKRLSEHSRGWWYFPHYWPFVRGIHRSTMNSPHKGQWRRALMFSLIFAWVNGWVNIREAGDLRRYRAHYDVPVVFNHVSPDQARHGKGTHVAFLALFEGIHPLPEDSYKRQ